MFNSKKINSRILIAHTSLFLVNVFYGANYIIAKGLMPDVVGPSGFIVIRAFGAVLLYWFVKFFIREKIQREDWWRLVLCGLFGVCANQLLFFNGLAITSPINASIILTSNPVMVLIIAAIILKERITWRKAIGILLASTGAIYLITSSGGIGTSSVKGDLFVLLNALSYAFYLVIVKPLMSKYHPITVTSWVFFFGMLMVLPIGWNQFMEVSWSDLQSSQIIGILYVVVITTFLVFLLNVFALRTVSPTIASTYIYLQPIMVIFFGWLFFTLKSQTGDGGINYNNEINIWKILSALLIFLGVYLVSFSPGKKIPLSK